MTLEYFSLPLSEPLSTAAGDVTDRSGFLLRVDEPAPGIGEATPLAGWTESLSDCERALRDDDVDDRCSLDDLHALPPAARHGASLAMLDARAREDGLPLYRYLGVMRRVESVPVNATVGDADAATTVRAVGAAVEDGFGTVKLKAGVRSLDADVERVRAVREVHPSVDVRLDANGAWSTTEANRAVDRLGALDVEYVEQPLPAADLEGHASLRGRGVDVALDEGLYEHGLDAVFSADAADVLVLKPMAMGGPDVAVDTAVMARGAGIDPVVTTTVDGAFARAAAVHVAATVPEVSACGLATRDRLAADFVEDPAPVGDGRAAVPQGPGNTTHTALPDHA